MKFALVITIYTALGGPFDKGPSAVGYFETRQECQDEATRIEARSEKGWHYIAICERRW